MNINEIDLKNIDKDMPFYGFIGKTIEKLIYEPSFIILKFTDGTFGRVDIQATSNSSLEEYKQGVKSTGNSSAYITGGILPASFYD